MLVCYAYENFLSMEGLSWKRPVYKQPDILPFIPKEAELDQLIAHAGKKLGTFLQGLKDTGADPGESGALRWTDVNVESRTIQIRPVKGHNARVLRVSQQFIDRLQLLPRTARIFSVPSLSSQYIQVRKRAAEKFSNPRLKTQPSEIFVTGKEQRNITGPKIFYMSRRFWDINKSGVL